MQANGRSARRVAELIDRDGPACAWCGLEPWPGTATVDHVCPKSKGGTGETENLVLSCARCNRARRSRPAAAHLRAQREAGKHPREDLVRAALDRLAGSSRRPHREYADRQLRHWPAATRSGVEASPDRN